VKLIVRFTLGKTLRQLLDQGRLEKIADMALRKKRVLGSLVALTFDVDPRIGWRAVEAIGIAADRVAERDPDYVRGQLRRLYWLISEESGGICWHAPEAMAEIIRQRPVLFEDYGVIVISLLTEMAEEDLEHFRPGILWAIGRLADVIPDHVAEVIPEIVASIDHADPQVCGMAVWCLGKSGKSHLFRNRPELLYDQRPVDLYEDGNINRTSVGGLARSV